MSADPVDDDWTARFFGHAQDVSTDEMKRLWGQILAGEVRRPGSFSMRCLDVVRNLSKYEAEAFERIAPFVIDGSCVAHQNRFVGHLPFGDHLTLSEAGLMVAGVLAQNYHCGGEEPPQQVLRIADIHLCIRNLTPTFSRTWELPVFVLNESGVQLARLFRSPADRDYVWWLATQAANQFEVSIDASPTSEQS